jgi:hypothetical protein
MVVRGLEYFPIRRLHFYTVYPKMVLPDFAKQPMEEQVEPLYKNSIISALPMVVRPLLFIPFEILI